MDAITTNVAESEAIQCLVNGLNTQGIDDFLDRLFSLAGKLGNVTCSLLGDRIIRLQSHDVVLQAVEAPRAKSKLRMVCARLAVRCGEWCNRKVSPYGDTVEFELPRSKQFCKVEFEN